MTREEPVDLVDLIELTPSQGELVAGWRPEPAPRPRRFALEIVTLALPVLAAAVYLFAIAAPRYVAVSEFMVRTLAHPDAETLASLMSEQKITRASDETYAAAEYLVSREAVDALAREDGLKAMWAQGDFVNRFPNVLTRDTREQLFRHFLDFVDLDVSSESGIARLSAVAFTPQDALKLNQAMLRHAEGFINRLNARILQDSLDLAAREVEQRRSEFSEVEARLTAFRNAENVVDPNKEVADALARIGALMTRLSKAESELTQATTLAPRGPQVASLASEAAALRDQIAAERLKMIGQKGSLADKFAAFDRLMLDRLLASKQWEAALAQYDKARQDVARQHFYLQTVVAPEAPDQAQLPRRFASLLAVAAVSAAVYAILRAVIRNVREHAP